MKIGRDLVVSIDYTLTDDAGSVIDSNQGQPPMQYVQGHGQIVPGLERALAGRDIGEKFSVDVLPADGYGERDADRLLRVPRAELPEDMKPEIGMQLAAEDSKGHQVALWVAAIEGEEVILDANHPLAGATLHFAVVVREVRTATKDELSHGHVHGEEGEHEHEHGHGHAH